MMSLNYSISCVPVFSRVDQVDWQMTTAQIDALVRNAMITASTTGKTDVNE